MIINSTRRSTFHKMRGRLLSARFALLAMNPLLLVGLLIFPSIALSQSIVDFQRKEREQIELAIKELNRENWRLRIVFHILDSFSIRPEQVPEKIVERIARALLARFIRPNFPCDSMNGDEAVGLA